MVLIVNTQQFQYVVGLLMKCISRVWHSTMSILLLSIFVIILLLVIIIIIISSIGTCSHSYTDCGVTTLLITAHPDDEAMFFGPLIANLVQYNNNIILLCLSQGIIV